MAAEFATYLNFCRSLRFDDKPDYSYLRQLFRNLFHKQAFTYDYIFDWNMLKVVSLLFQRCYRWMVYLISYWVYFHFGGVDWYWIFPVSLINMSLSSWFRMLFKRSGIFRVITIIQFRAENKWTWNHTFVWPTISIFR